MELVKVNKHHSCLAETAGGYVHLGCAPATLLRVHSCLLLFSNCVVVYSCEWNDMQALAFIVQLLLLCIE